MTNNTHSSEYLSQFSVEPISSISDGVNKLPRPEFYNSFLNAETHLSNFLMYYTSPGGHTLLRSAIRSYERCLTGKKDLECGEYANNICLTAGATSGIFYYFRYMRNKKALFLGYHYIHFKVAAEENNVSYKVLVSKYPNRVAPTIDEVAKIIHDFDFVTVTLPCNPSGEMYNRDEIEQLLRLCIRNDVQLLIDKCQWDEIALSKKQEYYSIGQAVLSQKAENNTTIITSFSKTRSIPGARLGYAFGPHLIIEHMIYMNNLIIWHPSTFLLIPVIIDFVAQLQYLNESKIIQMEDNFYLKFRHYIMLSYQSKECIKFILSCISPNNIGKYKSQLLSQIEANQTLIELNYNYLTKRLKELDIFATRFDGGFNVLVLYPNLSNYDESEFKKYIKELSNLCILTQSDFCASTVSNKPIWIRVTLALEHVDFKDTLDSFLCALKKLNKGK